MFRPLLITVSVCAGLLSSIASAESGSLRPSDVTPWTDAFIEDALNKTKVPGAVVIIVDHGQVVYAKGFGVTEVGRGRPINPAETLFRIGSISKVFTALIATKLIEDGAIDPRADVNEYLQQIEIPRTFGAPVTVEHLLHHEAGFASDLRGMERPTAQEAALPPDEMQRLLARRLRPPGLFPAYDNNGWGVLGLALADSRQQRYSDLVDALVLTPFGMNRSSVGVPDEFRSETAVEHLVAPDGTVRPLGVSLLVSSEQGAGDVSATGLDMAKFMTVLLQRGRMDDVQLISPEAYAAMTDFDARRLHPALPGYGRALYESRLSGRMAMRHDGGMRGAASTMVLYPDANVGVFIAINARPENPFDGQTLSALAKGIKQYLLDPPSKVQLQDFLKFLEFHEQFAERFIPLRKAAVRPSSEPLWPQSLLGQLEGRYIPTASEYEGFAANLQVELIEGRSVKLGPPGKLLIGGRPHSQVQPGLFQDDETGDQLAFARSQHGTFLGGDWLFRQRLAPWWRNPIITVAPLLLLPLLLLSGLIYRRSNVWRGVGLSASALGVVYLFGWLLEGEFATSMFVAGTTLPILAWRLAFALAVVGLAIWPLAMLYVGIRTPFSLQPKALATGAHLLLLGIACSALVALSVYWNLLNPVR